MSTHTHLATEPNEGAAPRLRLDTTRAFGSISPPERLACAGGEFIPTGYRDERPDEYARFMRAHADHEIEYKTRCFEQDGFSFDADGNSILECMDVAAVARARKAQALAAAETAAREAHRKAMREAGFADEATFRGFQSPRYDGPVTAAEVAANPNDGRVHQGAPRISDTFDIPGWAVGRIQAPFFRVQKAIREQHGFSPVNKAQALEWLREHGVIQAIAV